MKKKKQKTIYDDLDRTQLIRTILYRDERLTVLERRTLDDYVKELVENAIQELRD